MKVVFSQKIESDYIGKLMQISLNVLILYWKTNTKSLLRHTFFNIWDLQNTHPRAETPKNRIFRKIGHPRAENVWKSFFHKKSNQIILEDRCKFHSMGSFYVRKPMQILLIKFILYWKNNANFTHFILENQHKVFTHTHIF